MNKLNLNKNFNRGKDCSSNQDEEDIIEKNCQGIPPLFGELIKYARSLKFEEEPAYLEYIKKFRSLFYQLR